jgi:hypothetical protein
MSPRRTRASTAARTTRPSRAPPPPRPPAPTSGRPLAAPRAANRHARPTQTVPGQARDLWAQACLRHVEDLLQALDRGEGVGLPAATAALMNLPTRALADRQASRRRGQRVVGRLERITRAEPLTGDDPSDERDAPAHRRPRGPAAHLTAAAIRRHIANGSITNAIDALPLVSPTAAVVADLERFTPMPRRLLPLLATWPQWRSLRSICELSSTHSPVAGLAGPLDGHTSM